ncbi:hypothetical protein, partial [Eudoraea sp.]|uniref:hypothetical protein n=1 Tax=Eudoraea sp. TaxID=1979955 RepID=UPI003C772592
TGFQKDFDYLAWMNIEVLKKALRHRKQSCEVFISTAANSSPPYRIYFLNTLLLLISVVCNLLSVCGLIEKFHAF